MPERKSSRTSAALRRALAVAECGVSGFILLVGYGLTGADKFGAHGEGNFIAKAFGLPLILAAAGVALAALTAWRGRGQWWVWQVGMLAWVAAMLGAGLFGVFASAGRPAAEQRPASDRRHAACHQLTEARGGG